MCQGARIASERTATHREDVGRILCKRGCHSALAATHHQQHIVWAGRLWLALPQHMPRLLSPQPIPPLRRPACPLSTPRLHAACGRLAARRPWIPHATPSPAAARQAAMRTAPTPTRALRHCSVPKLQLCSGRVRAHQRRHHRVQHCPARLGVRLGACRACSGAETGRAGCSGGSHAATTANKNNIKGHSMPATPISTHPAG